MTAPEPWACKVCGGRVLAAHTEDGHGWRSQRGAFGRDTFNSYVRKVRECPSLTWLEQNETCVWCFQRFPLDTGEMGHTTTTDRNGLLFCRDCLSCKPRIGWRHECRGKVRIEPRTEVADAG